MRVGQVQPTRPSAPCAHLVPREQATPLRECPGAGLTLNTRPMPKERSASGLISIFTALPPSSKVTRAEGEALSHARCSRRDACWCGPGPGAAAPLSKPMHHPRRQRHTQTENPNTTIIDFVDAALKAGQAHQAARSRPGLVRPLPGPFVRQRVLAPTTPGSCSMGQSHCTRPTQPCWQASRREPGISHVHVCFSKKQ